MKKCRQLLLILLLVVFVAYSVFITIEYCRVAAALEMEHTRANSEFKMRLEHHELKRQRATTQLKE